MEDKENIDTVALISNFDHEFETKDTHFTFLDTMKKPT